MTTIFRRTAVVFAMMPGLAGAQDFQSHNAIDATVSGSLDGTGLTAIPVDRRLKLAACPEPLRVDAPARGFVAVRCVAMGWRVRLVIDGTSERVKTNPVIIKRGDPVRVNYLAPGFSVTSSGIAESEARIGERVRVRIDQKATPLMAQAVDAGLVRVDPLN